MRCPKCHYLSFDPEPRCKNCGYDLEVADAELALRAREPLAAPETEGASPQWEPDAEPQWDPDADAAPEPARAPRLSLLQPESKPQRAKRAPRKTAAAGTAVADRPVRAPRAPRPPQMPPVEPPAHDNEFAAEFEPEPAAREMNQPPVMDDAPEPAIETPAARFAEPAAPARTEPALVVDIPRRNEPAPVVDLPAFRTPFRSTHATTTDLPLFVKAIPDNDGIADAGVNADEHDDSPEPIAPVRFPPAGPPLAVRRGAPEPIRSRQQPPERRTGTLDHDLLEDVKRLEREVREEEELAQAETRMFAHRVPDTHRETVSEDGVDPMHRIAAAAIDVGVLGGIATFVFWATLRLCNVSISALSVSALAPLLIFLVMMDVGYLLMFTAAGGQTVGKMLMHIRVVDDVDATDGVSVSRAASRAVLTVVSLGIGWLPALFGRGTLHDRLAHTRVVRA